MTVTIRRARMIARRWGIVLAVVLLAPILGLVQQNASTASQWSAPGPEKALPSQIPGNNSPAVHDGRVLGIAQVGENMVIGGTFTSVDGQPRSSVAAFNATTGDLVDGFAPTIDGQVDAVVPGPAPDTVFVAGDFQTVNSTTRQYLALLNVNTGAVVTSFTPVSFSNTGPIRDIIMVGNRLYVAGHFKKAGTEAHAGLVALNATTGRLDPQVNVQLTGHHNDSGTGAQGPTGPWDIDVTRDGKTLVAIGNFKYVDGTPRSQLALFDVSGATAQLKTDWATLGFAPLCSKSFDSYVRGVSFSPDGSYFAVAATGAKGNMCDSVTRWETNAVGTNIAPTWINETGGDTLWGVTVTDTAVYVGGHNRWSNNPVGTDRALAGAVARPGLQALDPQTGRPFSWNPGRSPLGVAVFAMVATPKGLWIGSNTDYVGAGEYWRPKVAFFPYEGGTTVPENTVPTLPGTIALAGDQSNSSTLRMSQFDGTTAQTPVGVNSQGIDFANWRGSFQVGNKVFYGHSDGWLYSRTFDGTTFGPAVKIDPYHDPKWDLVSTNLGQTFTGAVPSLYGSTLGTVTGMFYADGRLYYTRSRDRTLRSRWFLPESGILDENQKVVTSSVDFTNASGMFVVGNKLYYGSTDNKLRVVDFVGGQVVGTPTVVNSTENWRNRAMFLFNPPPPNAAPTAAFSSSCTDLTCSFDASGSSDTDGDIESYEWTFGDGTTASGTAPSHEFLSAGTFDVTLTVTDDDGAIDTKAHQVVVTAPQSAIQFVGSTHSAGGNVKVASVEVPPTSAVGDTAVMFLAQTSTSTWTGPATVTGWKQQAKVTNGGLVTTMWTKTLTAEDLGKSVTFNSATQTHATASIAVYEGVDADNPVTAFTTASTTGGTQHRAPSVTPASGDWIVSYWSGRANGTRQWTAPEALVARDVSSDSGTLSLQAMIADNGAPAQAVPSPERLALTDLTTDRAIMLSVALNGAG